MTAPTTAVPHFTNEDIREVAANQGVCVRPVLRRVTDQQTGQVHKLVIPCGSTREYLCPPCAKKAQRLRMQQCAEGWHLEDDPLPPEPDPDDDQSEEEDPDEDGEQDDNDEDDTGEGPSRRVRSTRRRSEMADLPKVPAEHRSVGRTFTAPDGTVHRPSMFVTVTLPSYGRVHPYRKHGKHGGRQPGAGCPVDPDTYDYRGAALDALHFAKAFDRLIQNLRRCAGFKVQYFAAIEEQLRLAPHVHIALRGAIPRWILRQVIKATYYSLWWPPHDRPVYVHRVPVWDPETECYRDPDTGFPLPTWEEALAEAEASDPEPAHVVRFGTQVDIKGVIAPSEDANRTIRYLTKYLTKAVSE
ncbi:MAG TPA: replication initiator, partial [Nocardioidaceae bacterium]|nr:replication initiator [Nocardioidaceae bacterium]